MSYLVPIGPIQLPVAAILADAVIIPVPQTMDILEISGCLQALISGTFGVDVKDRANNVLGALSWTAPGVQRTRIDLAAQVPDGGQIRLGVTGVGLGMLGCYITIWGLTA